MRILVTNDDSHRSELLAFLVSELEQYGELTIVVPKHEQSWKGKAMTRFEPLHVGEIKISGRHAYTVDGTPADCINLAIHNLYDHEKPDLIVSGINAGRNTGVGFVLSSGTVGACFEANIAGIPAIALSQYFDGPSRDQYITSYSLPTDALNYFSLNASKVLSRIFKVINIDKGLISDSTTLNINLPYKARDPIEYRVCSLGYTRYGSCFKRETIQVGHDNNTKAGRYTHDLAEYIADPSPDSDFALLEQGYVTLSPLDLKNFGTISNKVFKQLADKII